MNILLLADQKVGIEIARFMVAFYRDDLRLVVVIAENEIYRECVASGIPVAMFESETQIGHSLQNKQIDLGILAWWPRVINTELRSLPLKGFINTHPSLLPHNRGKHPNFWAIVEEAPFGVSLHYINSGIDSGDIVAQRQIRYDWTDNAESLYLKACNAMVSLFSEVYPCIRQGTVPRIPQDHTAGTFHRSSEREPASRMEPDRIYLGKDLLNRLRARTFPGHPSCWFEEDGQRYEVRIEIRRA